jgi:hypothetical protein
MSSIDIGRKQLVGSFSRYEIENILLVGLWLGMKCSVDDWTLL